MVAGAVGVVGVAVALVVAAIKAAAPAEIAGSAAI